jgi:hypothetical protein
MQKFLLLVAHAILLLIFAPAILGAGKPHTVTFGNSMTVKLFAGPDDSAAVDLRVRGLYVDGKLKEFTTGTPHEITDQQFAVQRAYRVNDSLPQDGSKLPKWKWQRGAWLLVNRTTGHLSILRLPEFDAFYSDVAWYRDYAAYCGVSDTGDKLYAVVAQLGARKPILRKLLRPTNPADTGQECARPVWQRQPTRVTFDMREGQKLTFTIRGRSADVAVSAPEPQPDESESN